MRVILHYGVLLLCLCLISAILVNGRTRTQPSTRAFRRTFSWRGGAFRNESAGNATVEEYVAAMKEKDDQDQRQDDETPSSSSGDSHDDSADESDPAAASAAEEEDDDPAIVGVKAHPSKLSGAVGDPEDDSDDSDDDTTDFSEEWEELEEFENSHEDHAMGGPQVQVELEMLEDGGSDDTASPSNGGGVGVRLGRMNNRRKNRKEWRPSHHSSYSAQLSDDQVLLQTWVPHVFFPPTSKALAYLVDNSRLMDAASKSRLDRRTLYACLLNEWGRTSTGGNKNNLSRKFFPPATSQALHAALSMATQPEWRKSSPRTSGIRLYQDEDYGKSCTLAMQETIAMALAHSLGCGMLILDDNVINSVRQQMSKHGLSEEELKPAALIQSLLRMAQKGKLSQIAGAGTISSCMKRDLSLGLDDPYDDRASHSCEDMVKWEEEWDNDETSKSDIQKNDALPLVIFIRTTASNSLLKSKSAMELLIQECTSNDSIHLVTLGKGVDASTKQLPREVVLHDGDSPEGPTKGPNPSSSRMFGFSPQNQNASGQNDPAGSRRFNIFLARTIDPNGIPGILGAVAPPQAGNLFPHMMAMQARERLQNQDDDSPVKAELERWSQLLQQQMQQNGGMPMPPPQFFNASLGVSSFQGENADGEQPPPPPPEVIEQTLQQAMSELLDRLAQMNEDDDESASSSEYPNDLHKAFAQVLRNDNLRRGIAENLARAAPALSDPKCQGVMLSVYVPPPQHQMNGSSMPGPPGPQNGTPQNNSMGGWFQKVLHSQEDGATNNDEERRQKRQKRVRTAAAAAAVIAANNAQDAKENVEKSSENKAERNLVKLESICRPIAPGTPPDPVRAKSWESWISRERGSVIFRQNRKTLNDELALRKLALQQHTGTRGAGSALRQMLSVRDLGSEMEEVIKCTVELEAAKSLRQSEAPESFDESSLEVDISLSQLVLSQDGTVVEGKESVKSDADQPKNFKKADKFGMQYVHPSSLETSLSMKCHISPSPSGGLSLSSSPASHRSREEISALAQDKHERALVSQVVSPQDIGVTYDMIGGLTNVKELLRQSITYPLKFPHLYSEGIAREAVKGVLLFGPPGTGKTMLAKAVATEGGASFLSVDASSVENKWLGESEKNAKAVFTLARRLAPCVIFIDEVDSLLSSREGSSDDSAHGTLTSVKTTMMSEWDGLNSGTNGNGESGSDRVVVIGSTNRPFDLDEAVLRRFPRRILVDLPDLETRTEILEVTLSENRLDPAVNLTQIAERLEGYTGSDIKEVCREAVVQISHEQAKLLDQGLVNAREDVTEGSLQRLRPVTKDDFETALRKLKRSVSENGRELARVWEWNDEYGEIKKEKTNHLPHLMNMYL